MPAVLDGRRTNPPSITNIEIRAPKRTSSAPAALTTAESDVDASVMAQEQQPPPEDYWRQRLPSYDIKPPTTTGDKGHPSPNILRDTQRIFEFITDERHLVAHSLYQDVHRRLQERHLHHHNAKSSDGKKHGHPHKRVNALIPPRHRTMSKGDGENDDDFVKAQALLDSKQSDVETLENRCRLFRHAQRNLMDQDDWIFASHHFGIDTYYRRETDMSLSIKLEGVLENVPLFEQVCVLREVDLHYTWAPFCFSSMTLATLDKLDLVGWFMVGMPNFGLARDGCFRAIGCDNIEEDGTILLAAQGVQDTTDTDCDISDEDGINSGHGNYLSNDAILQQLDIPPKPTRRGCGRITIHRFEAMIQVTSPTSATTKLVANVNPNINFLPKSLLDFVLKHMAGVMLNKMQAAALKVGKNPKANPHAKRMRAESAFYKDWLMAKFQGLCKEKGWEMPPVLVFDYEDEEASFRRSPRELQRTRTYSGIFSDSTSTVADNMSAMSSPPPQQSVVDDEDVSDVSTTRSGPNRATTRTNPIRNYMAEIQRRTEAKKAAKVAAARQVAAERLKPKELSVDKQMRLQELKMAMASRRQQHQPNSGYETQMTSSQRSRDGPQGHASPPRPVSLSALMTERLHAHNRATRVLVVSVLVKLLFAMLHPVALVKMPPLLSIATPLWLSNGVQDAVMVLYILLCGVVHFALCDVALVYAFSSLDLGQKAGREVKLYYSANVRMAVAGGSLFIVAASIIKAWIKALMRSFLWCVTQTIVPSFQRMLALPASSVVARPMESVQYIPSLVIGAMLHFVNSVVQIILVVFFRSNRLGREFESLIVTIFNLTTRLVSSLTTQSYNFLQDELNTYESELPWRDEAFGTARTLFTYSSVFLLTILVLFHFSAKRSSRQSTSQPAAANNGRNETLVTPLGMSSRRSTDSIVSDDVSEYVPSARPRASTSYDTIPEHEEVHHQTLGLGPLIREEGAIEESDDDGSRSRRPRRLRTLRPRAWTAPDGRKLRKSVTY